MTEERLEALTSLTRECLGEARRINTNFEATVAQKAETTENKEFTQRYFTQRNLRLRNTFTKPTYDS